MDEEKEEPCLSNLLIFENIIRYLPSDDVLVLELICFRIASYFKSHASIWEFLLKLDVGGLQLKNCFRRASNSELRELDKPPPNVNRNGTPSTINCVLCHEHLISQEYCQLLRKMYTEEKHIRLVAPIRLIPSFGPSTKLAKHHKNTAAADFFKTIQLISIGDYVSKKVAARTSTIISGGITKDTAAFSLWASDRETKTSFLRGAIFETGAASYDLSSSALAIGCTDGNVKVWDFSSYGVGWEPLKLNNATILPCTTTLSNRSGLAIPIFLKSRPSLRLTQVKLDTNDRNLRVVGVTGNNTVTVWDIAKNDVIMSIAAEKIHATLLPRASKIKHAQVSCVMLFRNKLAIGTSFGLIRVFDLRTGNLVLRVGGHPEQIRDIVTNGGAMWSGGVEGSVRWWGGKTAKVLKQSRLCAGAVTALEIDAGVLVVGFEQCGMAVYDINSQNILCTFSNKSYGGIQSIQFDETKLITLSTKGQVAMWRWSNHQSPHYIFPPADDEQEYVSAHFGPHALVLGGAKGIGYTFALNSAHIN